MGNGSEAGPARLGPSDQGVVPREVAIQRAIAAAIGKRLGRRVGLDECGFTVSETIAADLGLAYPSTVSGAVTAAAGLLQADLAKRSSAADRPCERRRLERDIRVVACQCHLG